MVGGTLCPTASLKKNSARKRERVLTDGINLVMAMEAASLEQGRSNAIAAHCIQFGCGGWASVSWKL